MENAIICGDCIEEMKKIKDNSIDCIFADPPYWMRVEGILQRVEGTNYNGCDDEWDNQFSTLNDYETFTFNWLKECYRILKPNGSFWVIGSMQCIYTIGAIMQNIGFWLINDVIWHKKNPTPNFKGTRLNNSHETLIWATKDKKAKFTFNYKTAKELNRDTVMDDDFQKGVRKQLGSVWKIGICQGNERLKDVDGKKLHNTQKPEELLYRVIAISTKKNDLVLDPFAGTMTTGAVAKKLGRRYLMIERDKNYCQYGKIRIDNIKEENTDIANAIFDIKPLKVTMQEMIEKDFFHIGEKFYLKKSDEFAILQKDGKLLFNNIIYDMHTCAAIVEQSTSKRLNGFKKWYVIRKGEKVSIDSIREMYRQFKSNSKEN